jgi:photosystem II stability/assembly factor-like uncharacterized protein
VEVESMSGGRLYLGTRDGVVTLRRAPGAWEELGAGLKGLDVSCIAHHPERPEDLFVGTIGRGVYHSADAGRTWSAVGPEITFANICAILFDPHEPRRLFVGTQPAALFRSDDGGRTWAELATLTQVPGHERWYLPLFPRAGAARSIAAVPALPGHLYVGIEMGGVVFTADGGLNWTNLTRGLNEDVHQVVVATNGGSIAYVATGGGVYRSFDGGRTWEQVSIAYTRAVAAEPGHAQTIFAGPALRVGHLGRVERSRDAGSTWEGWSTGLGEPVPGMVNQLLAQDGSLDSLGGVFAVLSTGEVYHSELARPDWASLTGPRSPTPRTYV